MNHKKLLLTLTLCLCALLCMVVTASASEVPVHSHFLCGGNSCTAPTVHQGDVQTEFTQKLTSDNGILKIDDVAANKDTSNIGYELKEGSYYLGNDISLDDGLCITGNVTLCLNGHDIVTVGNVVQIQDDNNFTLCDCKGNKAGYGKFTSNDGGRAVSFGGSKPGTFTMYGGIITGGNVTGNSGGGVFVGDKNTFTMYGGTITGNRARYTGGGVVVYGTFKMYGGAITGNSAQEGGGGVAVHGIFKMYGGTITNNTCGVNYNGGGVYVEDGRWTPAAITLSGNVQIKDNYRGSNSNKKPSNLYLTNNKEIAVEGSLTGSSIGVTTAAEPGTGSNVTFAVGSENTITTGIFTPDTAGVLVGVAADGTSAYLYQCPHTGNTSTTLCTDWDYHWYECSVCGGIVDKEEHDYSKKVESADYLKESATCIKKGTYYFSCAKCGASCADAWRIQPENPTFEGGYGPHNLTHHAAQLATCTAVGWEAYDTCSRCDYTTKVEIPAAHTYGETWVKGQDGHWKECEVCRNRSEVKPHNWRDATYTAPKTCTVCGATQGEPLTRSYYYYAPSAAEDKKESPKAGDPGVLLYAGLALASLTGLTYTAKKRH